MTVYNGLERKWKRAVMAYFKVLPGIILGGLMKSPSTSVRIISIPAKI
jgi:hypothetical protein